MGQLTLAEQNFVAQKYYKEKMSVQAIFKNYHKERVQVKRSDSKTWAQGLSKREKLQLFREWNQAYSARKKEKWAKEAEIANAQFRKKLAEDQKQALKRKHDDAMETVIECVERTVKSPETKLKPGSKKARALMSATVNKAYDAIAKNPTFISLYLDPFVENGEVGIDVSTELTKYKLPKF